MECLSFFQKNSSIFERRGTLAWDCHQTAGKGRLSGRINSTGIFGNDSRTHWLLLPLCWLSNDALHAIFRCVDPTIQRYKQKQRYVTLVFYGTKEVRLRSGYVCMYCIKPRHISEYYLILLSSLLLLLPPPHAADMALPNIPKTSEPLPWPLSPPPPPPLPPLGLELRWFEPRPLRLVVGG